MEKNELPWGMLGISRTAWFRARAQRRDPNEVVPRGKACRSPYKTYRQAAAAARLLGMKTKAEYRRRFREDPRLCATPETHYGWFRSWGAFLGTGRTRRLVKDCYATWQEAGRAAKKLGCLSSTQYRGSYKEDSKLPRNPDEMYRDFPGWDRFLSF